ncbi:ParB/RepB/Spo0J family partition protein [Amycolatopsis sp. NPDC003676]
MHGGIVVESSSVSDDTGMVGKERRKVLAMAEGIRRRAPVRVPIKALLAADSPRINGENDEHVRTLAESGAELPPIIVQRGTMRVIDGMHRLRAQVLRGAEEIEVLFFDGDDTAAYVLGVCENISHGLPLSLADRTAAASRIIASCPSWSDRVIAAAAGLSPHTVGGLRQRATGRGAQLHNRVGADGRVRPINSAGGRELAARLIAENPDASLRDIARSAGLAPGTVRDVLARIRRGADPVPQRLRRTADQAGRGHRRPDGGGSAGRIFAQERALVLRGLRGDPSLRLSGAGRMLLRLLDVNAVTEQDWERIIANVPDHCKETVLGLAEGCAEMWQKVAERLAVESADGTAG